MNEEKQATMKLFLKYFWRLCLVIIGCILLYFIIALILSYIPASEEEITEEKNKEIFIQSNGTHLDIVVPVEQLDWAFKQQLHLPENTAFVSLGWGNKEFFFNVPEWKDLTFGLAFRALFFRLESAMHVIAYSSEKENWTAVKVSKSQMEKLNHFIEKSFTQKNNTLQLCMKNSSGNNCFYDAEGKYSCINTCNVWVNDALKEADIPTSVWSPFHIGVLHHLD